MNRVEIIRRIARRLNIASYLEIGVNDGYTFLRVPCWNKIGVDPSFRITRWYKFKRSVFNPTNIGNRYFRLTSDSFFQDYAAAALPHGADLIFIDGLHTFEQSFKDLRNSLEYLNEGGVIIMHDCSPPDEASAYPVQTLEEARNKNPFGWSGNWCGDVWKTIPYIRSLDKTVNVTVIDSDFGVGIIRKGPKDNSFSLTPEECLKLSYKDLEKNRTGLLNLKGSDYFPELLSKISSERF